MSSILVIPVSALDLVLPSPEKVLTASSLFCENSRTVCLDGTRSTRYRLSPVQILHGCKADESSLDS